MADKIEARTGSSVPNVAILDWGVFSANPVDVDWLTKSTVSRWAVWALREAFGSAVDVMDMSAQTADFPGDVYAVREGGLCMGQGLADSDNRDGCFPLSPLRLTRVWRASHNS